MLGGARTTRAGFLAAAATVSTWMLTACGPISEEVNRQPSDYSVMTPVLVPPQVKRLAVWYPHTSERDVAYGYMRLEQAAFQLKKRRSWITIVERRHIESLTDEQRFQVSGRVADASATRIGRWLGADSMVIFQIDGPTWRERLLARFHEQMPPVVVSSKIISVETGEVLYHDIVSILPVPPSGNWGSYASDPELQPALRSALDHALSVAIAHLDQAFQ